MNRFIEIFKGGILQNEMLMSMVWSLRNQDKTKKLETESKDS